MGRVAGVITLRIGGAHLAQNSQVSNLKWKEMSSTNNLKSRLASTVFRFSTGRFHGPLKSDGDIDICLNASSTARRTVTGGDPNGAGFSHGGADGGPDVMTRTCKQLRQIDVMIPFVQVWKHAISEDFI